jgi:hypothetical protein
MDCAVSCPVKNTLRFGAKRPALAFTPRLLGAVVILLFLLVSILGRTSGHWKNGISNAEYRLHVIHLDLPAYQHNRGRGPDR